MTPNTILPSPYLHPTSIDTKMGNLICKVVDHIKNTICDMAPPIVQYVVKHPIKAVCHVASATMMLGSSVIAPLLLGLAGFTSAGVAAGSLAAAVQSSMGTVVAGGAFATLQSAAMGGYGAAIVAGAMSGAAVAAEVVPIVVSVVEQIDCDSDPEETDE
ncbi:hypothetical protein K505DRAFT_155120 [Melanomma pulvis-pyrius CBS 109.77]|uniref:Uncharacterized protein n=1 Tax=Melanomma pulvis-pyrius CBS 109.77 TaxID=1314802 RepID=A0A6A6XMU5_9PLEO|nr:hypothetical protein K505DRAFT_155120 [Melanomma pulvis-pyrius CBS 109.77]